MATTLVLIVLIIYFILMLLIGVFFKSRMTGFEDFILGNRGLPWFVISMTMLATLANAQQTLGISGNSYLLGLSPMIWYFILVNIIIYPLINRLGTRYRHLRFSTIVDLAEARYVKGARLSILVSVWQVLWAAVSTAICIFGGALVVETVFGVPLLLACAVVTVITLIYCIMGGFNAVVFSDTMQWLIIIAGTAFLVPAMFSKYGTFSAFFSDLLGNTGMTPAAGSNLWAGFTDLFTLPQGVTAIGLVSMGLAGSLWIPIDLGFMQRMLSAKDEKNGRRAALGFLIIVSTWAIIMVIMGMYGTVLFPGISNTDTVIMRIANDAMPGFGFALFITAIAAAVMSTASTYLNAGSAILAKNIYKRFIRKQAGDAELIKVARYCNVLIAAAALSFAPIVRNSGVFNTAITFQMIMCASLTPLILLTTYWKKMAEPAAFWGGLISSIVTFIIVLQSGGGGAVFAGAGIGGVPAIIIGIVLSTGIYVIGSLVRPCRREEMGKPFRDLFEHGVPMKKQSNRDIIIIGIGVALILIPVLIRTFSSGKVFSAFPPLGGFGAKITDWFFIALGIVILIICVIVAVLTFRWARGLSKRSLDHEVTVNQDEAQTKVED